MGFITLNNGGLIHTSNLFMFATKNTMYEHVADINMLEGLPDIVVNVDFIFEVNVIQATESNINAIIDTGASHSYISRSIVPDVILNNPQNTPINIDSIIGNSSSIPSLDIPLNVRIKFSGVTGTCNIPIRKIIAVDTSITDQKRASENRKIYHLVIGGDVLRQGELKYNIPVGKYELKF